MKFEVLPRRSSREGDRKSCNFKGPDIYLIVRDAKENRDHMIGSKPQSHYRAQAQRQNQAKKVS
jgi:hypothetical protein